MNNKKYIAIAAVVVAIVIIVITTIQLKGITNSNPEETPVVQIPQDDAFDVTTEFYNQWLDETLSTTTDPYQSGLINSTRLSNDVRTMIQDKQTNKIEGEVDAVFCQLVVPERVAGKEVFKNDTSAQIIMFARGFEIKSPYQSVVTLDAIDGNWQITKIECVQGEVAPEREYDFERTGYLLKSVQPPLNPEYWHLVYEENGKPGHALPLFFDAESICVAVGGADAVCDTSKFVEPAKVLLQADMLDNGADVRRVTFEKI
jgi:hypothetical protein